MSIPFGPIGGIPEPGPSAPLDDWRVPIVRIRDGEQTGVDRYDEPVYGPPTRVSLPDGLFHPTGADVAFGPGVDSTVTEPTVMWPMQWPDVKSGDRLEIDGDVWVVHERPASWPLGLVEQVKGAERRPS